MDIIPRVEIVAGVHRIHGIDGRPLGPDFAGNVGKKHGGRIEILLYLAVDRLHGSPLGTGVLVIYGYERHAEIVKCLVGIGGTEMPCKVHVGEGPREEGLTPCHSGSLLQTVGNGLRTFDEDVEVLDVRVGIAPVVLYVVVAGSEVGVESMHGTVVVAIVRHRIEVVDHKVGRKVEVAVVQRPEAGHDIGLETGEVGLAGDDLLAGLVCYGVVRHEVHVAGHGACQNRSGRDVFQYSFHFVDF